MKQFAKAKDHLKTTEKAKEIILKCKIYEELQMYSEEEIMASKLIFLQLKEKEINKKILSKGYFMRGKSQLFLNKDLLNAAEDFTKSAENCPQI